MKIILAIVTGSNDPSVDSMLNLQEHLPDVKLEKLDLRSGQVDYHEVLHKIFEADSIQVW